MRAGITCYDAFYGGACAKASHEHIMKLTEEFRQNADEWRQIEKIAATDEHRQRIAEVADTWLALAERREQILTENLQIPDER